MDITMDITFVRPFSNKITVYSKSGCNNCDKVKMLLEDLVENSRTCFTNNDFSIVNCDKLLENNKELFIYNIEQIIGKISWQFPLVFANGNFIGGFKQTLRYFDEKYLVELDLNTDF